MAQKVVVRTYPWRAQDISEAEWRALVRRYAISGVVKGEGTQFDAEPGSGLSVIVHPGHALLVGQYVKHNADATLDLDPADANNPRKDLIVAFVDMVNREGGLKVKTGTPASNPSPPSVTQQVDVLWEEPLWEVHVAAGATSLSDSDLVQVYRLVHPHHHAATHASDGDDPITPADIGAASETALQAHENDHNNPHHVTAAQAGAAPSQHASQHASGGSDPITPADIGAAAASHTHPPSDITPQGAGSGLDADKWQGQVPGDLWSETRNSSTDDWNDKTTPGWNDTLMRGDAPHGNGLPYYYHVLVLYYPGGQLTQIAIPYGAATNVDGGGFWVRGRYNGTWSAWRLYGGRTERGSNANGEYSRFANGVQICWEHMGYITHGATATWTYPASFIAAPVVVATGHETSVEIGDNVTATSAEIRNSGDYDRDVHVLAIGRWK